MSARADEESTIATWCWINRSPAEQADRLLELARWVSEVLRARYPGRAEGIRPCWPEHPTVLEELSWLYGEWWMAYINEDATNRLAGEWHDRWLDGVLQRFARDKEFSECEQNHRDQLAIATKHGPDSVAVVRARQLQALQQSYDDRTNQE
jgi:hypothetical protein